MSGLTLEETRALASLSTLIGYRVLIDKVVKLSRENALAKLKSASGQEAIIGAALTFRIWDDVVKILESKPAEAIEELKTEGDNIYG